MKVLFVTILMLLLVTLSAFAQYTFQITTDRDTQGMCINWQDITADVSYKLNPDTTKQVFTIIPDSNSLENDDKQEWYVDTEDNAGHYLVDFSFTGVGLSFGAGGKVVQYWFRFSMDGVLFGPADDCIVLRPGKPQKK